MKYLPSLKTIALLVIATLAVCLSAGKPAVICYILSGITILGNLYIFAAHYSHSRRVRNAVDKRAADLATLADALQEASKVDTDLKHT